jgi:hypothetical protein
MREVIAEVDALFTDALLDTSEPLALNAASRRLIDLVEKSRYRNKNSGGKEQAAFRMEKNCESATERNHLKLEAQVYAELLAVHICWLFDSAVENFRWNRHLGPTIAS